MNGMVDAVHARLGRSIDQHAVDDVREVVAGLAMHGPVRRQVLEGAVIFSATR